MCISQDLKSLCSGEIVECRYCAIKPSEKLFCIEVQPHHNFFAGRTIMHNDNSLTIVAYVFSHDQPVKKERVSYYLKDVINSIPLFKESILKVGGRVLNSSLTFGDYQLNNFGAVFVFTDC